MKGKIPELLIIAVSGALGNRDSSSRWQAVGPGVKWITCPLISLLLLLLTPDSSLRFSNLHLKSPALPRPALLEPRSAAAFNSFFFASHRASEYR